MVIIVVSVCWCVNGWLGRRMVGVWKSCVCVSVCGCLDVWMWMDKCVCPSLREWMDGGTTERNGGASEEQRGVGGGNSLVTHSLLPAQKGNSINDCISPHVYQVSAAADADNNKQSSNLMFHIISHPHSHSLDPSQVSMRIASLPLPYEAHPCSPALVPHPRTHSASHRPPVG